MSGGSAEPAAHAAWYVVETQPRAERTARTHLERQGFACFCPRFRKTRRHARRIDEVDVPVFPGYLFVAFDRERDNWTSVNGTRGVKRLVGPRASRPQPMPAAAMQALFARCWGEQIATLCPTLVRGQQVRVLTGPFADRLAEIDALDDRGRVRILLAILGATSAIAVSPDMLEPA